MKIIDEKGKLFGIVNIVDFIVCALIVCVGAALAYQLISARAGGGEVAAAESEVYLTVKSRVQPQEVVDLLNIGDKLVARNAFQNAEIVSVHSEPAAWVAWSDEGEAVLTVHPIWKDIVVVIKDKTDKNSPILRIGGQEARSGREFILKTQFVEVPSIAYTIEFK